MINVFKNASLKKLVKKPFVKAYIEAYTKAYTLVEILAVLVISSIILLLTLNAGFSASKTFIDTLSARSMLEFVRTVKSLAIVVTENPGEYVYGLGLVFTPDSNLGYHVSKVRYSISGTSFYRDYVDPTTASDIVGQADYVISHAKTNNYSYMYIPPQAKLEFAPIGGGTLSCDRVGIIFEQLFGKPHFYCINGVSLTPINSDLMVRFGSSNYKIIINLDSEIYGSYKQ